jgi:hypothetical protein
MTGRSFGPLMPREVREGFAVSACDEARIHSRVDDPRTRQLLLDAITWALAHPEPLLEGTRSELDSPNIVALTLLVDELHSLSQLTGITVRTFIHDEQEPFGKYLKMAFDVSKRFGSPDATSPLALIIDIKDMVTFDCEFRAVKSKNSFGLQLLDVALCLTKRFTDNPDAVRGKSRELAEFIRRRAYISEFTRKAMFREVVRGVEWFGSTPLSAEQEARGRELLAELEAQRIERMHESLASSFAPATVAAAPFPAPEPTTE